MRADRDMADPEGEAANRAIDEYAERLWNELGSLESVESLGSLDAVEAIEERIHNATEELEGKLTDYYKSVGNLEHDAVQASRDMSRRVRAEVSVAMLKRRGELTDAPETSEVSEVSEKSEAKSSTIKTAGGDAVSFESMGGMRKLEDGEFTLVERKFSETGEFGFTGKERVESIDDVAYIFRALEDFSVENAFVALVKDGVPTVVHLGMGDATQTLVNMDAAYASMKAFGADEVYFVHNHPNGTLRPSAPDENMCRRFEALFGDKLKGCLIMNLRSGKYCLFGGEEGTTVRQRPGDEGGETIRVKRFDRQVFSPGYEPERITSVTSSKVIAEFIASQRLGGRNKVSFLILNHANQIVGNIHTPYSSYSENAAGLADMMTENAVRFGGMKVVPYGNVGFDGLRTLAERIKNGGSMIRVLDAVNVMNGLSYESAFDRGVMESGASYTTPVEQPRVSEPSAPLSLDALMSAAMLKLANRQADSWQARVSGYRSIVGNLSSMLEAMKVQKEFDKRTVKAITDLAQSMLTEGMMTGLKDGEVKRLLSAVKNATGKRKTDKIVQGVYDIMTYSQLRHQREIMEKLLSVKGTKINTKGVEIQGRVDSDTAAKIKFFRTLSAHTPEGAAEEMAKVFERLNSADESVRRRAEIEAEAGAIVMRYQEEVRAKQAEESSLRADIRQAYEDNEKGLLSQVDFNEFKDEAMRGVRRLQLEQIEGYASVIGSLQGVIEQGKSGARAFIQREKDRMNRLYDMVNADMGRISSDEHRKDTTMQKITNSAPLRFLTATLPSFNEMMKLFAQQHPGGRGELYDHYMTKWLRASEEEYTNKTAAMEKLGSVAGELFGKTDMRWNDAAKKARNMRLKSGSKVLTVEFVDANGLRDFELGIPELAYIYAVNKMEDGRMKLRKMGIDEADVERITGLLPDEIITLVDKVQGEFLPELRQRYNEVYERMYGTSMAEIENYFPLKILKNHLPQQVDTANLDSNNKSSTTTGSIIKRTRNSNPLDLLHADFFNVMTEHVRDMEHWAAYSEFAQDVNSLLSMPLFRNKVRNMTTIFGSGEHLLKTFERSCQIATGDYQPDRKLVDAAALNFAKAVTTAKVSFRVFTAFKQLASLPAFGSSASGVELIKAIANPAKAFRWCLDNLPLFHKRWIGRMSGEEKLLPSELDAGFWHKEFVEKLTLAGMTPNAFVDAATVAIGSYATYKTQLKHYERLGIRREEAERKAKDDASLIFNETQQSSESAFLSNMQVSRTWGSVLLTVFRNASIGYQRKYVSATRDLYNHFIYGGEARRAAIEQKLIAAGLDAEKAKEGARKWYSREIIRDVITLALAGFGLQLAWYLQGNSPYYLFGKDEDEKKRMVKEDLIHSAVGGMVEGLSAGDAISNGLTALLSNGSMQSQDIDKEMPVVSDLHRAIDKFGYDNIGAWNDILNVVVQSGVAVNPQTITDACCAVWDYCGQDARTSQEFAILMMRILQTPQSQLDKIYFDELNVTGEQAKKMTPQEIAQRYAAYKVRRGAALTYGFSDEGGEKQRMDMYNKKAISTIKSQMTALWSNEVNEAYDKYSAIATELNALQREANAREDDEDEAGAEKIYNQLENHIDYDAYESFKDYNPYFVNLSKQYVEAKTLQEAEICREALKWLKPKMIEYIQARTDEDRDRIADEIEEFQKNFELNRLRRILTDKSDAA